MGRRHLGGRFDDSVTGPGADRPAEPRGFLNLRTGGCAASRARSRAGRVHDHRLQGDAERLQRRDQARRFRGRQRRGACDDDEARLGRVAEDVLQPAQPLRQLHQQRRQRPGADNLAVLQEDGHQGLRPLAQDARRLQ